MSRLLPRDVYRMCVAGALLVGSRALVMAGAEGSRRIDPHDYDLLVPYDKWQSVTPFIPSSAKVNKFGGWRFNVPTTDAAGDGVAEVDVWPGSIGQYLSECKSKHGVPVCAVDFINNRVYSSRTMELL